MTLTETDKDELGSGFLVVGMKSNGSYGLPTGGVTPLGVIRQIVRSKVDIVAPLITLITLGDGIFVQVSGTNEAKKASKPMF